VVWCVHEGANVIVVEINDAVVAKIFWIDHLNGMATKSDHGI
jgi:hypothetical protein